MIALKGHDFSRAKCIWPKDSWASAPKGRFLNGKNIPQRLKPEHDCHIVRHG